MVLAPYSRVTTQAKLLTDATKLGKWATRQTVIGFQQNPALFEAVAWSMHDRRSLDNLCEEAMEASGAGARSALGTALHLASEQLDQQITPDPPIPAANLNDLAAYQQVMARAGITILPKLIERIIINRQLSTGGTADRYVMLRDGSIVVLDLKTGATVTWGALDMAIQLAIYANADAMLKVNDFERDSYGRYMFDADNPDLWEPMPKGLRTDIGIIAHMPAGEGICTLHTVNLARGWEAAKLTATVRDWRSEARKLMSEMATSNVRVELADDLGERASAIWATGLDNQGYLKAMWSHHGLPKIAEATSGELSAIKKVIVQIEGELQMPFAPDHQDRTTVTTPAAPAPPPEAPVSSPVSDIDYDAALARLEPLFPDLVTRTMTTVRNVHGVTNLNKGIVTAADWVHVIAEIERAETDSTLRAETFCGVNNLCGVTSADVGGIIYLASMGAHSDAGSLTGDELDRYTAISSAMMHGLLVSGETHPQPADGVLKKLKENMTGTQLLSEAKAHAKRLGQPVPSKGAEVAERPLLIALLHSTSTSTKETK